MRRRTLAAVAVAAILVLAGCAGADPGDGTTTEPPPSETTTEPPSSETTTEPPPSETTTEPPTSPPPTGSPAYDVAVFDSGFADHPVIEGGLTPSDEFGNTSHYTTVLTEASETERFNRSRLPQSAVQFVDETDFETASLVVVQAYPKSSVPDYRVESVTRDGDWLDVRINDSSMSGTDDITIETVLIRVYHDGDPPTNAQIETQNGVTFDSESGAVQGEECSRLE